MSSDRKQKQYLQKGNSPGVSNRGKDPDRPVRFARCARSLTALARRLVNIFRTPWSRLWRFLFINYFLLPWGVLGASWRVCKYMLELKSPDNNKSLIAH